MEHAPLPPELESIAAAIVDSAMKIHRAYGPGLLESVYERCLAHELTLRGFHVERQVPVPLVYEGLQIDTAFRIDILVNNQVIIETKAVAQLTLLDRQQTLTHLRLANKRLAFLINFNVVLLKDGIARIIN